jgi:5-methylcytosine-specific restriction protein A
MEVILPTLKSSGRRREYDKYGLLERSRVVYAWLFEGKTHRQLDDLVLGLNQYESKGFQSMGILHFIGLRGDSRGIYQGVTRAKVSDACRSEAGYRLLLEHLEDDKLQEVGYSSLIESEMRALELARERLQVERLNRIESCRGKLPERIRVISYSFKRNPDVVAEALYRANGHCESCNQPAPFLRTKDNSPYLEVHHIVPLADGGDDTLENVVAICPNCHRRYHFG